MGFEQLEKNLIQEVIDGYRELGDVFAPVVEELANIASQVSSVPEFLDEEITRKMLEDLFTLHRLALGILGRIPDGESTVDSYIAQIIEDKMDFLDAFAELLQFQPEVDMAILLKAITVHDKFHLVNSFAWLIGELDISAIGQPTVTKAAFLENLSALLTYYRVVMMLKLGESINEHHIFSIFAGREPTFLPRSRMELLGLESFVTLGTLILNASQELLSQEISMQEIRIMISESSYELIQRSNADAETWDIKANELVKDATYVHVQIINPISLEAGKKVIDICGETMREPIQTLPVHGLGLSINQVRIPLGEMAVEKRGIYYLSVSIKRQDNEFFLVIDMLSDYPKKVMTQPSQA